MIDIILKMELELRLGFFIAVLAGMAWWETLRPRRERSLSRSLRWPGNLGVAASAALLQRVTLPATLVGVAVIGESRGWGLLALLDLPYGLALTLAVLALDLTIYLQHVMFHAVPLLWRLHRMHHADLDFDVTTGVRFHPVEILLSAIIKLVVIASLGAPPLAVLVFELMLNATALFNHSNVAIPQAIDRWLRWFVVTPDMHRVHHSIIPHETNSNFGFNLSWWDRLCGTYRAQPEAGHDDMTIGIRQFRDPAELRFDRMLLQPFRGDAGETPINRR
ncbi:MAG: sterol desaturase family protein [Gammaproteobacteria bacterium]